MLALLAGAGALPAMLVGACAEPPLVCAIEGFAPEGLRPDLVFRLETLGTLIETLKARGVTEVCFAGATRRPKIDPTRIDAATRPLVPIVMRALAAGDDGALGAMIAVFEAAGMTVLGAHQVAPDLLPPVGVATRAQPSDSARADVVRAMAILDAMSGADLGQSCAVLDGQALAMEGIFGTDWMLASLGARPDGGGGVFCKAPKTTQDRRADLPAIGVATVAGVRDAGLAGLVIEAGGVMVLDQPGVVAECDAAGLFLWVRERGG